MPRIDDLIVQTDARIRALERTIADLRRQLADERAERIAADRRLLRAQHDRDWRREVA